MSSVGALSSCPSHRSFFRDRLQRLAHDMPVETWVLEEANARGYFGAIGRQSEPRAPTPGLDDEELIVALLMPHAEVDARLFKLIVRMLQRAPIDSGRLWLRARRERADVALWWLLSQVPSSERTGAIPSLLEAGAPRNARPLAYRYDAQRLLKKPATAEALWTRARRSS
ncbi:MAG: hypothetical protein JNJ54_33005 [Myxococcaceae bacterium]|nr:hypothetical protein [Myxococcaceae bacterium]